MCFVQVRLINTGTDQYNNLQTDLPQNFHMEGKQRKQYIRIIISTIYV